MRATIDSIGVDDVANITIYDDNEENIITLTRCSRVSMGVDKPYGRFEAKPFLEVRIPLDEISVLKS